jgi:glycosyltransferase involved in cell wall biosynthesis
MHSDANPITSKVSVIIPAYNVASCLQRAVLSVLKQQPPPCEIIIINDGSTDETASVARSFGDKIVYVEQPNKGPAAARNVGLVAATYEYVAFLDADDYWLPGFIKATVDFLKKHPEAVAVSTGWHIQPLKGQIKAFPLETNGDEIPRAPALLSNFFEFWGQHDHIRTGTVLMRRSKLGKTGFQREDLRICEDLEFWGYLAILGSWGFIPDAYWFGDSARIAARDGWLKKYVTRRQLCPTVEEWQKRICLGLREIDQSGFTMVRGRVAASYAQNMILAGRFEEARKTILTYGKELPKSWLTKIMIVGDRLGFLGWIIACVLLYLREYQKAFFTMCRSKLHGERR